MKNIISLLSAFLNIITWSVYAQETPMIQEQYDNSLAIFEAGKKKHNNCYMFSLYITHFDDRWSKTSFVVENGVVIERRYARSEYTDESNEPVEQLKWVERGADLGSHNEGFKIMTMDELYKIGKKSIDVAPIEEVDISANDSLGVVAANYKIFHYHEFDNQGILNLVGYEHEHCNDDCFRGYRISDFKWGIPKKTKPSKSAKK